MAQSIIPIENEALKKYLIKEYVNTKFILNYVSGGEKVIVNTKGPTSKASLARGNNGIPKEYVETLNNILIKNIKLVLNEDKLIIKNNIGEINNFFEGKIAGCERMKYIENGSRPSSKYFFFSIYRQKLYAKYLNSDATFDVNKYRHDRFGRPVSKNDTKFRAKKERRLAHRKRFKQFELRGGDSGQGIMALYDNFSPRAKGLLTRVFGQRPTWPGFKGIKVKKDFSHIFQDENFIYLINRDERVVKFIENLVDAYEIEDEFEAEGYELVGNTETIYARGKIKNKITKKKKNIKAQFTGTGDSTIDAIGKAFQEMIDYYLKY